MKETAGHKVNRSVASRLQRFVVWLIINGVMCYALYMAMWLQNEKAANVVKFMIWLNFMCVLILQFAGKEVKERLKAKGPSVPYKINFGYGLIYSCILAAFGWFGYATLDIITTFMQLAIYGDEEK